MTRQRPSFLNERQAVEAYRSGKTGVQIAKEIGRSAAAVAVRYRKGLALIFHGKTPELADLAPLRPKEKSIVEQTLKRWPNFPYTLIAGVSRDRLPNKL